MSAERRLQKSAPAFSPPRQTHLVVVVDAVGAIGAALCAVHCAAMPLLLALLPLIGVVALGTPSAEYGYVAFATALGLVSLGRGYLRHRAYWAFTFLGPGLVAVWAGVLAPGLHEDAVLHAATMTLGGALIAIAHLANLRLSRGMHMTPPARICVRPD